MLRRILKSNWLILPAVAIITAIACAAALELGSRILFPQQIAESCQLPSGAERANCNLRMKAVEGPWVTESFNDCGSRSIHPCSATPVGNRVVVLGDSVARGYGVRYEDMFAPRAEAALDHICSTPVEFQNLSLRWPVSPDDTAWTDVKAAAHRAAMLHPKVILLFVTQWDMYQYRDPTSAPPPPQGVEATSFLRGLSAAGERIRAAANAEMAHVRDTSRFVLVMRRFLSRRDRAYLKAYGAGSDLADYLRPVVTPAWDARVKMVPRFAAPIAAEAARAGADFAVVYIAPEPPILLVKHLATDAQDDPFVLSRALGASISDQDWQYIDTLPAFAAPGTSDVQYFRINGHPNPAGHAAIARALTVSLARDRTFCAPSTLKKPAAAAAPETIPVSSAINIRSPN